MKNHHIDENVGQFGAAIGRGLLAGLVGTLAITLAQMIEMRITGRRASNAPAEVAGKMLGVEPRSHNGEVIAENTDEIKKANEQKFGQLVHWGYGTGWGICRGLLSIGKVKGPAATALHFGAIWGTELVMVPAVTDSPPATQWGARMLAKDALFHLVYAVAAGAVYDAIDKNYC